MDELSSSKSIVPFDSSPPLKLRLAPTSHALICRLHSKGKFVCAPDCGRQREIVPFYKVEWKLLVMTDFVRFETFHGLTKRGSRIPSMMTDSKSNKQ